MSSRRELLCSPVSFRLHLKLRTEGIDCGDEVADWLSSVLRQPGCRLAMYREGLFTERHCVTDDTWWNNNPVPERTDEVFSLLLSQGFLSDGVRGSGPLYADD